MIKDLKRKAKIATKRAKKKKNPFRFRPESSKRKQLHLAKRHSKESKFQFLGILAIGISFVFLGTLLISIVINGYTAFIKTEVQLSITFDDSEYIESTDTANFRKLVQDSLKNTFSDAQSRRDRFALYKLVSKGASHEIKAFVKTNKVNLGDTLDIWVDASSDIDMYMKGRVTSDSGRLNDKQIAWIERLKSKDKIKQSFNVNFFNSGDSREPEQAGILTSIIGSLLMIIVCIGAAFPVGVLGAVYLEEFAKKNWLTDLIEININNLAAVPSIIFGLLGLAVYLNFFGMTRSSSVVGGLTLALLVLPVIVISTRNALKAVPPSVKFAATALGATKVQVAFHHTVPYAMPGIMTGVILSVARALGETAPLLMIGMVAFVADAPKNFIEPATTLPVQVFLWSDSPEIGFVEKTSAAIIVLLLFLMLTNSLAIYLRKRFEIHW